MTSHEDRFRELDRIPVPDQWEEIQGRQPGRLRSEGPTLGSRAATMLIALVLSAAGITVALLAFWGEPQPIRQQPHRQETFPGGPQDRQVLASGQRAGVRWEVFTIHGPKGPAIGSHVEGGGWGYSYIDGVDPCVIESDTVNWVYLAQNADRIVVLQYHAVPRATATVEFILTDGRSLEAAVVQPPSGADVPFDAFAITFEGPPGTDVSEVRLFGEGGTRLDNPARC
jgi:hypothetical protein